MAVEVTGGNSTLTESLLLDQYLEDMYGHLSPTELAREDIDGRHKARVAQLQMTALYVIAHTCDEMAEWLRSYQVSSNQIPDGSTYN